jgi:hypothetical protein
VTSQSERLRDGAIGGEKPLGLAWRFKPPHAPFPLAVGLMGVFRPLHCAIAFQLIGDDQPWDVMASFEEFPEELLGCPLIPSAQHQDLEDVAVLIHRMPQIMALPFDRQKDLLEMPLVALSRAATAQLVGMDLPKFPPPLAGGFIRHESTTREQQFLDVW